MRSLTPVYQHEINFYLWKIYHNIALHNLCRQVKRINLYFILLLTIVLTACEKASHDSVLQSITFEPKELTLSVGQSNVALKPIFKPKTFEDIPVVWSNSDVSVVKIVNGKVEAIGSGEATITIKDKNSATIGKIKITVQ